VYSVARSPARATLPDAGGGLVLSILSTRLASERVPQIFVPHSIVYLDVKAACSGS